MSLITNSALRTKNLIRDHGPDFGPLFNKIQGP